MTARASSMYSARYSNQVEGSPPPYHPCVIEQWASRVISYSSQYDYAGWSANQILGEPRVFPRYGDFQGAWASSVWNTPQFIVIEFEIPVRLSSVHIYETMNPGAVVRVRGRESVGPWALLWQTDHPAQLQGSRIFSPPLPEDARMLKINQLRIDLDMSASGDWCELDAVQVIGVRDGTVAHIDDTQFRADMALLVNNKLHSDVTFNVEGKPIYGHKAILATRSPFFAKMLEKKKNEVTLKLPQLTFDDLETVLYFLYTNRLPEDISLSRLPNMCKASSTFEVPELKSTAIYRLVEGMRCDNVVPVFMQSQDDPLLEDVKTLCRTFMASNLKDMSKDPSFEKLPQSVIVSVVQEATLSLCISDNRT